MFDERKPAVEAIFNRFCKPGKEGWINQVLEDTAGMLTGNFLKGCEAVKDLEEMPHNIAKEIRRLGHADQKKEYYYCSFCWGLGLIYHHEMIGAYYMQWVERCSCKSGEKYAWKIGRAHV